MSAPHTRHRSGRGRVVIMAVLTLVVVVGAAAAGVALRRGWLRNPAAAPTTPLPSLSITPAPTSATGCDNGTVLAAWSTARLANQTLVAPVDEGNVRSVDALVADGVGGVILFGLEAPDDLGASLAALAQQAPEGIAPFVMSDEEGGAVQRMPNLVGHLPSARTMAATMTPDQIRALARQVGTDLRAAGVTMDLAPVLDLDDRPGPNDDNPDGSRSFSRDPQVASAAGLAFAEGLMDAGVVPVVKHFPGLGDSVGNTDLVPAGTLPWETLQHDGLLPFADAVQAGIPAVMIANAFVPGLTSLPASVSPEVITGVLREQLHFTGLVLTDALSAGALVSAGYSVPQAAVAALAAGADLLLYAGNNDTTRQTASAIVAAVNTGQLSRQRLQDAVGHILAAKNIDLCHS